MIKGAIGEDVTAEELGGPAVAAETNGSAHMIVDTEDEALDAVRRFLSYVPDSAALPAPVAPPAEPARDPEELLKLVPLEPRRGYDMRKVLEAIVDADSILYWGERYGREPDLRARAGRRQRRSACSRASRCSARASWTSPR